MLLSRTLRAALIVTVIAPAFWLSFWAVPASASAADAHVTSAKPYKQCGRVPAFVSAAINVRQKNTSCRRARQIADLWQRNGACADGTCRLFGFSCSSVSVASERSSAESEITCKASGARVKFTEIVD